MNLEATIRNILIDCGKTFYESALTWFVEYRYKMIDAVILTHGHADAMMGMDDLRQWTMKNSPGNEAIQQSVPIYLDQETYQVVARSFPYMVDSTKATGSGEVVSLKFNILETNEDGVMPFDVQGTTVVPFEGIVC